MNTKTEQISSGLVAEFWLSIDCIGERYLCFSEPKDSNELHPLVRLSDAEAIIAAKDADIERLFKDRGIEHDLANRSGFENNDLRSKVAKQSAALKLAKDAFSAINIEAKTFMSYENARNNFSDDTDERKAYERAMVKASELTKQALAAIDSLQGEWR